MRWRPSLGYVAHLQPALKVVPRLMVLLAQRRYLNTEAGRHYVEIQMTRTLLSTRHRRCLRRRAQFFFSVAFVLSTTTRPAFITQRTFSLFETALMLASGSPSTATMSA